VLPPYELLPAPVRHAWPILDVEIILLA